MTKTILWYDLETFGLNPHYDRIAQAAVLKERSPSCGHGAIYDGTFTRALTAGDGVTAALLSANGIPVYGESRAGEL